MAGSTVLYFITLKVRTSIYLSKGGCNRMFSALLELKCQLPNLLFSSDMRVQMSIQKRLMHAK